MSADDSKTAPNNFSPRVRQVFSLARKEADRLNHNFVGTEHLLLGLIAFGHGVAARTLSNLGMNLEATRAEADRLFPRGQEEIFRNTPFTPRCKRVLNLAAKDAKAMNYPLVGTEFILLGLLAESEGPAAELFEIFKVDTAQLRREILLKLGTDVD